MPLDGTGGWSANALKEIYDTGDIKVLEKRLLDELVAQEKPQDAAAFRRKRRAEWRKVGETWAKSSQLWMQRCAAKRMVEMEAAGNKKI